VSQRETMSLFQRPTLLELTGELREPSMLSRTKPNVDHAGLSLLLALLKVLTSLSLESSSPFLSKNLSPATQLVSDVKVDGNQKLLIILRKPFKSLSLTIHIPLDLELPDLANSMLAKVKLVFPATKTSQLTQFPN